METGALELRPRKGGRVLRRVVTRRTALAGGAVVMAFIVVALIAPWVAPHDYRAQNLRLTLAPPSAAHPFGTDELGRDVFSRIILGARISLVAGMTAVGTGLAIGLALGALAGYFGGWVDMVVIGLIDIVWSFPVILLAIALVAVLRPGLTSSMIALGLATWPSYARVVRAQVIAVKEREYVEAARAIGCANSRLIIKHILPNVLSPLIVMCSLGIGNAIIVESTLSYLGLGAQPPLPSWGSMLSNARTFSYDAPFLTIIPGVFIMVVVLGFNLLGDALRDALDPRLYR